MKSATGVVLYLSFAVLQQSIAALGSNMSLDVNSEDVLERSSNNSAADKRTFDIVPLLSPPRSPSNGSHSPQAILDTIDKFWHDFFQTIIGGKPVKPRPATVPIPGSPSQRPGLNVPATTVEPFLFEPIAPPTEVDSRASGVCGKPSVAPSATPNTRIVNGVAVPSGGQPWACAMVQSSRFQYCGCTVIDRQWVATASHCVDGNSESTIKGNTKIFLGTTSLVAATAAKGNIQSISRVIMHPQYDSRSMNNDIALIKLATPITTFTDTLMPACLPTQPITAKAVQTGTKGRRICYTTGWGRLSEKQQAGGRIGAGTDLLQQTAIEIFSVADCQAGLKGLAFTDKMVCGGFDGGKYDSCQGDSGGPMVCDAGNGVWTLNGIVSFGIGCARAGNPGVYANVHAFVPWIHQTIANS